MGVGDRWDEMLTEIGSVGRNEGNLRRLVKQVKNPVGACRRVCEK